MFSLYTCVLIALVIIYISSHNVINQNIYSLSSTHEKLERAVMKASAHKPSVPQFHKDYFSRNGQFVKLEVLYFLQKVC